MTSKDLQFKAGNPGAVQHGNFINYYQFHPPKNRINLLPNNIWGPSTHSNPSKPGEEETFLALDIGCNAGNLTQELLTFLQKNIQSHLKIKILAVDIDSVLIQRAKEQFPSENIEFHCSDCTQTDFKHLTTKFLKENGSKHKFDAVFCFSTTMWIHLNSGDHGLKTFLTDISEMGELLVIEPQPWKCYRSAVKRMKDQIVFPQFKELKMRNHIVSDIETYICKQLHMSKTFESDQSQWERKIFCFTHQ